jgi:hypothetical protein
MIVERRMRDTAHGWPVTAPAAHEKTRAKLSSE